MPYIMHLQRKSVIVALKTEMIVVTVLVERLNMNIYIVHNLSHAFCMLLAKHQYSVKVADNQSLLGHP